MLDTGNFFTIYTSEPPCNIHHGYDIMYNVFCSIPPLYSLFYSREDTLRFSIGYRIGVIRPLYIELIPSI